MYRLGDEEDAEGDVACHTTTQMHILICTPAASYTRAHSMWVLCPPVCISSMHRLYM